MSGEEDAERSAGQEVRSGRDAFVAGRDLTVHYYSGSDEHRPADPVPIGGARTSRAALATADASRAWPESDGWIASVHASEDDFEPLGSGVVVAGDRVLTSAHVVVTGGAAREGLWVAFPNAVGCPRRRVAAVRFAYARPVRDVAVLVLENPVPPGAGSAPLRFPRGQDLVGCRWWAFGFPDRDPVGDSADGRVGAALSYGWVRLDTTSRYLIRPGFTGGGLWSPDYQAVVGIVGQAHANGDGRAVTLHQADLDLPEVELAVLGAWLVETAGEAALAQWGWVLDLDPEGVRHWRPRARGVSIDSERGWRFRGRSAALRRITSWLDQPHLHRRVLVVTGSPGVGKSAVVGRVVTTADVAVRSALLAALPPDEVGVLATPGSVSCAVHAKGKTALEVAGEIARAASAALPGEPKDLAPAVRDALAERQGSRFNIIIDALDEAASPSQAREVIDLVVLPLSETCSDVGVQVVVATRRRDDDGDLLSRFGAALDLLDLDDPRYFAKEDLAAYALACLQLAGDERAGSPYADEGLAIRLAARIAEMSGQNFLIAGLTARCHGLYDEEAVSPGRLGSAGTVNSVLAGYLQRLAPVAGVPASDLLTALAFAEAPGLPVELWQLAVDALYQKDVAAADLTRFARSSAANFLVEATGAATAGPGDPAVSPVYRLFHQAFNDALLQARRDFTPRAEDERALTRAFAARGRAEGWEHAPEYLLRSLPGHAYAGGLVDELLTDDVYLLHADLLRLVEVTYGASLSPPGRLRAELLRLTPQANTGTPGERAAMFGVTEALDNLGSTYRANRWPAPYHAQWAVAQPRRERHTFDLYANAVCTVTVDGRTLLASGGAYGLVRLWDSQDGEQVAVLKGHRNPSIVEQVCAVTVDGRALLASGSSDGSVRLWDPHTGEQLAVMEKQGHWVHSVCAVTVDGRTLLASGGDDGTVRLWNPRTSKQLAVMEGRERIAKVLAVCAVTVDGRALLASGAYGTVRLWDPRNSRQLAVLEGHHDFARSLCAVTVGGRALLASGDWDTVRLWDPRDGRLKAVLEGHRDRVNSLCTLTVDGRALLASSSADGTVRLWDLGTGTCTLTAPVHHAATGVANIGDSLAVALDSGIIVIKLNANN